jgi:hypothetical protein
VFAAMAGLSLGSALLMAPVSGPAPVESRTAKSSAALAHVMAGLSALRQRTEPRLLVATLGAQYVVIGALDVLLVVLAVGVLDMGDSGAGYLNAAFGAGGVLGIATTISLVGRRLLVPPLLLGAAAWSAAFIVIGLAPSEAGAFGLLAVAGTGRALFDVAGRTLLQRVAPPDLLARVFGVLESLSMAGLAVAPCWVQRSWQLAELAPPSWRWAHCCRRWLFSAAGNSCELIAQPTSQWWRSLSCARFRPWRHWSRRSSNVWLVA